MAERCRAHRGRILATVVNKYKYFIWTNDDTSEENVLFSKTLEGAIDFFNNLYMQVHADRRENVERIELTEYEGETILAYDTHQGVINGK